MFNEIEQLESEIVEFRSLVKNSSEILKQLDTNTNHIQQLRSSLEDNIKKMQERKTEIEVLTYKFKRIMALAALGILLGGASIVMNLII